MRTIVLLCFMMFGMIIHSQTTITGKVVDQNNSPIPNTNIVIVGKTIGTVSDFDGNFVLTTSESFPFKLKVTSVGFADITVNVTGKDKILTIKLYEQTNFLDEVVISASRTPERIFESPVTVERFGIEEIKNTASVDFYSGLENLKGVDVNVNSLTYKSINTRGFATFANTRFMQLVDGMDNSTPVLNFPIGNLVGMIETDVQSVEILPGASSALYGANAFNGILFMRSKSPFDKQGISFSLKKGITSQKASGNNNYIDFGIRAAYKFSQNFAAKINFGYLKGIDWAADSEADNDMINGTRASNLNYNGVNVYGDEVSIDIKGVAVKLENTINPETGKPFLPKGANALVPSINVSRTGYNERDLTHYNAESVKADWGLYYRPITDNSLEISYIGKVGTGSTIYQGSNRYNIDNFFQEQHKLEIKNDNFFLRSYIVADDAGDSYDMVFTGININRLWKSHEEWFGEYTGAFIKATLGGATESEAHIAARKVAESGRFIPGSPEFIAAFNKSINDPDLKTGSKFQDESKYYHTDANYNFSHLIAFADIQLGGSYRKYILNSSGTIYTDKDAPIKYSEYGIYTQIQKSFDISEIMGLKFTGSVRYDKSEFFDGFISPRISAGLTINKNHNIRVSVQTGFRNPTTQDLFIGLDVGRAILVGSAPNNLSRYVRTFDVSGSGQLLGQPSTIIQTAAVAYNNSYKLSAVQEFGATKNPAVLKTAAAIANPGLVKPEQVTSAEIGYRGKLSNIIIDFSTYYNKYKDFISSDVVIAPYYGKVGDNSFSIAAIANGDFQVYSAYTNSDAKVNSYGASLGLRAKVFGNFDLGGSYTFSKLDFDKEANPDVMLYFNTPEHKFKATFGNTELVKNLGFNIAYRFSDDYLWEATFGDGVVPEFHIVDAQINLKVPYIKSIFKIGGTNLIGKEYSTATGTGYIGSMYYIGVTINNL